MKIECDIWEVKAGVVTAIKLDGRILSVGSEQVAPARVKTPYLMKWIRENKIKKFNIEDFFKAYPKQRDYHTRLNRVISELITRGVLVQLGNKQFQVISSE